MAYARKTKVPVSNTINEIRRMLEKHQATGFAFGEQSGQSVIMFEMQHRRVKFILPMPARPRDGASRAAMAAHDQQVRSRWRSMGLAIKAKLECVERDISTFEEEFMAHVVLPNGRTIGEVMLPQIESAYKDGKMPPLLGYGS